MPADGHALVSAYGFSKLPGQLLSAGYVLSIVTGVFGFFEPSPASVQQVLGFSIVSLLWNLAFIWAGFTGLISRAMRAPRIEIIAVDTIAAILLLWAIMVFVTPQSNQAGIFFISMACLLFGWSNGTRRYLNRREEEYSLLEEG